MATSEPFSFSRIGIRETRTGMIPVVSGMTVGSAMGDLSCSFHGAVLHSNGKDFLFSRCSTAP